MSETEEIKNVENEINALYDESKKATEVEEAEKVKLEMQKRFDAKIASLGFVSAENLKPAVLEILAESNKELRLEIEKLKTILLRKKAQGTANIPLESKQTEEQDLENIYGNIAIVK